MRPELRLRSRQSVLIALLASAAACGERSAGTEQDPGDAAPQWSLAPAPELRIGADDADGGLHQVMDAVRLQDGSFAIVNAGAHQVRLVGADGHTLRVLGREGNGPGEFQAPAWIGARGDTVVVADLLTSRVTRFSTAGAVLGSAQFSEAAGFFPQVVGQYRDGTLLVSADEAAAANAPGVVRGRTALLRLRPDGTLIDTLAVVLSSEQFVSRSPDGRGIKVESLPFGRRTVMAMRDDVLYVGTGETPAVRTIDARGQSRDLLQVAAARRTVGAADVEDYWKNLVTQRSGANVGEPARPEGIPYPKTLPPYNDLHVDGAGRVWVGASRLPREWDAPATYWIYSPEGRPLGQMKVPARSLILDAGADWVLLREMDPDQRETVSLYRFRQPA